MSREFFGFDTTQARTLERLMNSDDAGLAALATSIDNLNTWANGIAVKLNTLGAKLNADAGVTDTNYAINYDTNPQA